MQNNKGFTMIELIAVLLIIGVITATIIPKIIDLEGSAERRLLSVVLSELNAREHMAWLDCKLGPTCEEAITNDLVGVSVIHQGKNWVIAFEGGGTYPVYKEDATDTHAIMWLAGKKPKPPKKPKK